MQVMHCMTAEYRLIWPFDALTVIAAANATLIVLAAAFLIFYLSLRRGRRLRDWGNGHRNLFRIAGVGILVSVFLIAWFQTGWYRHGIALFVAGVSGLVWMLFAAALTAQRTIRIQTMLWGTSCVSLVFAGWSMGISRFRSRARMIGEIRSAGGRVTEVFWLVQREESNLPKWSVSIFGQPDMMVDHLSIPVELFSPAAVRSWCFDDVTSLHLYSEKERTPVIKTEAIEAIPTGTKLESFQVSGCSIDERGIEMLGQFDGIETLRLQLQGNALPRQLGQFKTLRSFYLTNAIVDEGFIQSISTLPSLYDMTLVDPVFEINNSTESDTAISYLTITGGTLDAKSLTVLGSYGRSVRLIECRLRLHGDDSLEMPETKALYIERCGLTDAMLLRFAGLPKLNWITSRGDAVTQSGCVAFEAKGPDVAIESY